MKIFANIIIKVIKCYQFLISPLIGNSCRYLPTCSEYCIEAFKTLGFFKAAFLSLKRIFSCNPWVDGGFDPVSKKTKVKK
tara:strand:- start:51 stop:290 length:240 start_codon:yes stop_codon:yes gene_type:complete